jgi:glutamate-5-semialdehyde dehydrogenase
MNIKKEVFNLAKKAKDASQYLLNLPSSAKNAVLQDIAGALVKKKAGILAENKKDVNACRKSSPGKAFIDRLMLDEKRIEAMSASILEIASLADPCQEVIKAWRRPNGLWIHKVRVPFGVIAVIYESRPNVTSDCAALCFKTANSVILRGGSESFNTNMGIYKIIEQVLKDHKVPDGAVCLLHTTDRKALDHLLRLDGYIDLVIPRGGQALIEKVAQVSTIPVIKHYKGICHVYVDEWADLNMALNICYNAKVSRPGVCNAMESMLVHKDVAIRFLPHMAKQFKEANVEIRGCPVTRKIVKYAKAAKEEDYRTEYLDLIVSVKVVEDISRAISHINNYGSHHSDTIITDNYDNSLMFLRQVDSACVYVNASTRFTDGGQFGMGSEIGISTDKLHARGPMSLEELTTYKYMVFGNGQIRS